MLRRVEVPRDLEEQGLLAQARAGFVGERGEIREGSHRASLVRSRRKFKAQESRLAVVFVAELRCTSVGVVARVVERDRREPHAVEGRVLDHRVVRHVFEQRACRRLEAGSVEGVGADHVAGEAAQAAEPIRMNGAPRARTRSRTSGPVRHLEHVRHVCRGRGVEDRDRTVVFDDVEHRSDQHAGVEADRFARLEEDLDVVRRAGKSARDRSAADVVARAS